MTTELVHGGGRITDPEMVGLYRGLWDRLWSAAAKGDDARAAVDQVAREYRRG